MPRTRDLILFLRRHVVLRFLRSCRQGRLDVLQGLFLAVPIPVLSHLLDLPIHTLHQVAVALVRIAHIHVGAHLRIQFQCFGVVAKLPVKHVTQLDIFRLLVRIHVCKNVVPFLLEVLHLLVCVVAELVEMLHATQKVESVERPEAFKHDCNDLSSSDRLPDLDVARHQRLNLHQHLLGDISRILETCPTR